MQGLSHCFKKVEDGRLADVMVIEPVSSSSLECMAGGGQLTADDTQHIYSTSWLMGSSMFSKPALYGQPGSGHSARDKHLVEVKTKLGPPWCTFSADPPWWIPLVA
eukprot:GHRQ01038440.1.p2 GENE.GHRQ01038440.1~~GHRQ01038440.1.p2  ORF type:complete len:106 (-),score=16.35 GHRQ01038440.1:154-471(-)